MRTAAIVFAFLFVLGSILAGLYMMFAAVFPYEGNLSDEELAEDDWLAIAGPAVAFLAVATWILVGMGLRHWALATYVAHVFVGGAALWFALEELSDSSDHELIVVAASISFLGFVAVTLAYGAAHERPR